MKIRAQMKFLFTQILADVLVILISGSNVAIAQTSAHSGHSSSAKTVDIIRDPADVPPPVGSRKPAVVQVTLNTEEVVGTLDAAAGTTYRYWTFNGKVPGPMIRVKQGDMVEVTLRNSADSHMAHSVDFHAALGPGGGAAFTQAIPGQSKTFTFQATTPGLFVYHCGTPMIAEHIANGMYGLILVEPEEGLAPADREYYVMQGEIYTTAAKGKAGFQQFSDPQLFAENPQYFVFNGAVDALTKEHAMPAKVGDTVRIFFGDAGPNETSSLHVVGQIFTRDYLYGSLTSPAVNGVQTATIPPGGAAMLEFKAVIPGKFPMMDHAMARMAKGLMAVFQVSGPENAVLMHAGPAPDGLAHVSGMTQEDTVATAEDFRSRPTAADYKAIPNQSASEMDMHGMTDMGNGGQSDRTIHARNSSAQTFTELNGCLSLSEDGRAMLRVMQSDKVYRLEARPLLFSENSNHLVHVTGYFGSVLENEDPHVRSFVVHTVDKLASNCSVKLSAAEIRKALIKPAAMTPRGTVSMNDMAFMPATITVNAGEKVVWRNSSSVIHNVVADPSKALYRIDVKLPAGAAPFDSGMLQPGQSFSRVFDQPGVYHYVCTLHEGNGMKGAIIVRPAAVLAARR
jgi:copper-containing nitrite reductase